MKSSVLLATLILVAFLATPSAGQDLDPAKLQVLQQSVLTIKSFDSAGKLIREGRGFFLNAEGEVITNRQVLREAARVEIKNPDDTIYPAPVVIGVDEQTGILRIAASNLQSKVSFLSPGILKDKQTVFMLKDKGTVKFTEGTDFSKIEIPTLGQFYKVTTSVPSTSSGNPVVNSSGELIGILVVETLGGQVQSFIVPSDRIFNIKSGTANNQSLAEWNARNILEWLFTGPGLYYKGIVLQVAEGCAQALSVFESALEEDENNAKTWFLAGRCQAEMGDAQEAIEYQRRALRLNPDFAEAHVELGKAYIEAYGVFGEEAYKAAIDSFRKAIAIDRDNLDAHVKSLAASEVLSTYYADQFHGNIGIFPQSFSSRYGDFYGVYVSGLIRRDYMAALQTDMSGGIVHPFYSVGNVNQVLGNFERPRGIYEDVWPINRYSTTAVLGTTQFDLSGGIYPSKGMYGVKVSGLKPTFTDSYTKGVSVDISEQMAVLDQAFIAYGIEQLSSNVGGIYQVSSQPELTIGKTQAASFNPFLVRNASGPTYFLLGREYGGVSSYQKPAAFEPTSPFAHLYPKTSVPGLKENRPVPTSALNIFNAGSGLPFSINKRNIHNQILPGTTFDPGIKFTFGTGQVSSIRKSSSEPLFGFMGEIPILFHGANSGRPVQTGSMRLPNLLGINVTFPSSAIAQGQEPPETLFSASWFTQEKSPETANDLTSAQSYLQADTRYLLKVGLQDTPFATAVPAPPPGTITAQTSAAPSQLMPGTEMEVSYYSADLEPQRGSSRFLSPAKGELRIAAFPVRATTSDIRGVPVWIEIRLKGLVIYNGTLTIPIVPSTGGVVATEHQLETKSGAVLLSSPTFNLEAARDYEDLKKYDVQITITQQVTGPFYIDVDWKGVDSKSKPSGLTPIGLAELLNGVRGDLKDQLAAAALGGIKKEGSQEREIDALTMDPYVRQQLLFQLAKLGHRLYDRLFQDDEHRTLLRQIKEYAQAHPEKVLRIQIKNQRSGEASSRMLLPFGLLYDDPNFTENSALQEAKAENFWDSRFQIEFNETNAPYKKGSLCDGGPIRVAAAMDTGAIAEGSSTADEWRQEVREQQKYLMELKTMQRISLRFAKNEEEFVNIFKGDPSPLDLIYYYGHTSINPKPSFSITSGSRDVFQIRDAAMDQNKRLRQLQKHPFVFLNSCKGAAFSGDSQDTFLNLMNDLGASGFIGTETTVRIPYAARVGEEFFKKIVSYKSSVPLVQVLREMKHESLLSKDGNPLIMLYSIYGDPSLRTCSYK